MSIRTLPVTTISIEPVSIEETSRFGAYVFSIRYGGRDRSDAMIITLGPLRHERSVRVFYGSPEAPAVVQALHAVQCLERTEGGK